MEEVLDHNQEAEQIFRQYGRLLELVAAAQLPGRPEESGMIKIEGWVVGSDMDSVIPEQYRVPTPVYVNERYSSYTGYSA